jgi:hypothetical protein
MGNHSIVSPSSFERIVLCPASLRLGLNIPDTTSEYDKRGTELHEHIANYIQGKKTLEDIDVTHEESYALHVCYNKVMKQTGIYTTELSIDLKNIYLGMKGSIDFVSYRYVNHNEIEVYLCDFKFGKGVEVKAKNNYQLLLYLIGYRNYLRITNSFIKINTAKLEIIQPFLSEEDNIWYIDNVDEYLDERIPQLQKIVEIALQHNSPIIPSSKACRFCKVKPFCPELSNLTTAVAKLNTPETTITVENMRDEDLINILDKADAVETFIKSVRSYVRGKLEKGETVGDYNLVEGKKTRKYLPCAEEILYGLLGDKCYDKSLLGVTKMDKLVSKEVMETVCEKVSGNKVLVKTGISHLLEKE